MSKTISIYGLNFECRAPYTEGHIITEAEAKALNQTRAENVANNSRKKIGELRDAEGNFTDETAGEAAELFASIDAEYTFTLANVGGGRRVLDPVEKEATSIARAQISMALKKAGKALKDVDKDALAAKVAEVAATDAVRKLATKRVKERDSAVGEIDLGFAND